MSETGTPGRNVETKARCGSLAELASKLPAAGARYDGRLEQTDTYFAVDGARLKLREYAHVFPDGRSERAAELIRYERPDTPGARDSDYVRTPVADANACRAELAGRHGVRGVVRKRRELWLAGSTRVHLDEVEGLGAYVELETVIGDAPEETYREEHDALLALLGIRTADTIGGSYVDLVGAGHDC